MATPIALTVAGSDSSGGAGIQADLKTFSALSVYGASVLCALTAQNTQTVTAIHEPPTDFIAAQLDAVFEDLAVNAVKIGMLSSAAIVAVVADRLAHHGVRNIVLDPVMVSKSGARLLREDAVAALRESLVPMATVITPNLPEAADLLGLTEDAVKADLEGAAAKLLALGPQAVLVKGGHLTGDTSNDLLLTADGAQWFGDHRHPTKNTHGTGCTFSSAIAANLAKGLPLTDAVRDAKTWLAAAIRAADSLAIGHGHGPVHHFHKWW